MEKLDYKQTYATHVQKLKEQLGHDQGMKHAIGGEFDAFGILERELLIKHGLRPESYLIDVGCGSGRLTKPLVPYLTGAYLGTDVVPDLLTYARNLAQRKDWRFELIDKIAIPERDGVAEMVCFFSVFTHLLHEQSYVYLREAHRVTKPGGKIVFSFLEFQIPSHWSVFDGNIANVNVVTHLNMFMSRDGISAWAAHLGLTVEGIYDGDKPHIPLAQPLTLDDGRVMEGMGNLGQSVCVLVKD